MMVGDILLPVPIIPKIDIESANDELAESTNKTPPEYTTGRLTFATLSLPNLQPHTQ